MSDAAFMHHALNLARRNLGQTWPNPAVGAIVISNNHVKGIGWTARGGRPHAEPQALAMAGADARGATLYVTLEPCAHQGKTPPCTEAIINAGITRVVIACSDPHPEVNGKGIAQLRAAGIAVTQGVCEREARGLNEGFFSVVARDRPFVTLKIATSADGRIAHPTERWLTGEHARAFGHLLRAEHDAIMTGIGTVLADDPLLTCRLPGLEDRSPVRIVMDRQHRLPTASNLRKTEAQSPVWTFSTPLPETLKALAERGITRLLVEGGAGLTRAFLQENLVDRLYWFRAPAVIGQGVDIAPALQEALPRFTRTGMKQLDKDSLEIYTCSPA